MLLSKTRCRSTRGARCTGGQKDLKIVAHRDVRLGHELAHGSQVTLLQRRRRFHSPLVFCVTVCVHACTRATMRAEDDHAKNRRPRARPRLHYRLLTLCPAAY